MGRVAEPQKWPKRIQMKNLRPKMMNTAANQVSRGTLQRSVLFLTHTRQSPATAKPALMTRSIKTTARVRPPRNPSVPAAPSTSSMSTTKWWISLSHNWKSNLALCNGLRNISMSTQATSTGTKLSPALRTLATAIRCLAQVLRFNLVSISRLVLRDVVEQHVAERDLLS